jgi:hypothetical protein
MTFPEMMQKVTELCSRYYVTEEKAREIIYSYLSGPIQIPDKNWAHAYTKIRKKIENIGME